MHAILRIIAVSVILASAQGCAYKYSWKEDRLKEGTVEPISIKGEVTVVNNQPDAEMRKLYKLAGSSFSASLSQITEGLRTQLENEIGRMPAPKSGASKSISVKVTDAQNVMRATHTGVIEVEVVLGNGSKLFIPAEKSAGVIGGIAQALNAVIAEASKKILAHRKVVSYLSE